MNVLAWLRMGYITRPPAVARIVRISSIQGRIDIEFQAPIINIGPVTSDPEPALQITDLEQTDVDKMSIIHAHKTLIPIETTDDNEPPVDIVVVGRERPDPTIDSTDRSPSGLYIKGGA